MLSERVQVFSGDTAELRKSRGAFFTPELVCDFIAEWAIRGPNDRVLEPSCGEAAFMLGAAEKLASLGALPGQMRISGSEIHQGSAWTARALLANKGVAADIEVGDFLATDPVPRYDAVIGNPPYVRFHDFSGHARSVAREAALRQGVHLSKLASSWAAFVVHSSAYLTDDGRLGLVLPAELLAANYASTVRRFLLGRFKRVRLITFEEPVFPGVMTEAVLLLCEGRGQTDHFEVFQLRSVEELADLPVSSSFRPANATQKWTGALVRGDGAQLTLDRLESSAAFGQLREWGRVALGAVTGNNGYFLLAPQRAAELGLEKDELVRTSPAGSRHLRSICFTSSALVSLGRQGSGTLMFRPGDKLSRAAHKYISIGEKVGVQEAYKCRVRSPWWRVPLVTVPDHFITCMNADTPRLAVNEAKARHLNSVHGLYLTEENQPLRHALAVASLNSATLLGAELVGRAYGGGILKLEPGEAMNLPLPSPKLVAKHADELVAMTSRLRELLASGQLLDAVSAVDSVLLRRTRVIKASELADIRIAREHLAMRRSSRSGSNPKLKA
jgi:adenine-specific DNA methylase